MSKLARKKVDPDSKLAPKGDNAEKQLINRAHVSRLGEIGYKVRHLSVEVPETHSPEDVLKREYWANVVTQVNIYDKLFLDWIDGSKYWELKVIDKGDNWVQVFPLSEEPIEYNSTQEAYDLEVSEYEVKFLNPTERCGVVRKSDGAIISKDHQSKAAAAQWLAEYRKNEARG